VQDTASRARLDPLCNALLRHGHDLQVTSAATPLELPGTLGAEQAREVVASFGYDVTDQGLLPRVDPAAVWLLGVPSPGQVWSDGLIERARTHTGPLLMFQADDAPDLNWRGLPPPIAARAHRVVRNHWPSASWTGSQPARGWLPPMMRPIPAVVGPPLSARLPLSARTGSVFWGSPSHPSRRELVRMMHTSGLPFAGGIVPDSPVLTRAAYDQALASARICLAPWGAHPVTYRFFEGLAAGCLVLAASLRSTTFLDGGLEPGVHYVALEPSLSDLTVKVAYYLEHLDEAQAVADRGAAHYARHLGPEKAGDLSEWMWQAVTRSWDLGRYFA
jgi:hypothetical protein